jgi:hypothetical protein
MTKLYSLQETLTILLLDELVKERDYIEWEKTNAEGKIEQRKKTGEYSSLGYPDEFEHYFEDNVFGKITSELGIEEEIIGIDSLLNIDEDVAESLLIEFYRQQLYIFNFYIDNFKCCLNRKQYNDLTPIFGESLPNHPLLPKGTEDNQEELYNWLCTISENKEAKRVDDLISEYILEIRTGFSDGQQFEMDQTVKLNQTKLDN